MAKKEVGKAIKLMADAVRKKFAKSKADIGIGLSSLPSVERWVPSGCPPFDVILGGGIPCGRIMEIYGDESHGKSAIGECVLASAQRHGVVPILLDTEYSLEEQKAERWGLDMDKVLPVYPETMEQCFETIAAIIKTQQELEQPVVIVWDTLAATPTQKELEADYGDETPARQARLMSRALKKIYQDIAKTQTALIVLNQTRQKIGVRFGSKKSTPAGKALRFYAAIRVEIRVVEKLKKGNTVIGILTELRAVKNKLVAPFKTCLSSIYFESGVEPAESLILSLKSAGVIKAAGGKLRLSGESFTKKELAKGLAGDKELIEHFQGLFRDEIFQ